jgi:hypothetical protein
MRTMNGCEINEFSFLNVLSLCSLQPPWVNNQKPKGNITAINTLGVLLNNVSQVPRFIRKNTFLKTLLKRKPHRTESRGWAGSLRASSVKSWANRGGTGVVGSRQASD